jgi:hypothetical protein
MLAEGREASGVAVRDLMTCAGRVTGWLTPFRYDENCVKNAAVDRADSAVDQLPCFSHPFGRRFAIEPFGIESLSEHSYCPFMVFVLWACYGLNTTHVAVDSPRILLGAALQVAVEGWESSVGC